MASNLKKLNLDIDDLLEDLGDDGKPDKPTFGRTAPAKSKKDDDFHDFYDDESFSEANVGEIAKSLGDTDNMEKKLFGKKDNQPSGSSGTDETRSYQPSVSMSTEGTRGSSSYQPSVTSLTGVTGGSGSGSGSGSGNTIPKSDSSGRSLDKPMSAPGFRTLQPAKTSGAAFDDFEIDTLLPDEAPPAISASTQAISSRTTTTTDYPPTKSASLPLPDSPATGKAGQSTAKADLSSSGDFSSSSYMPSTGPPRSAVGSKSVSFAEDRPPTRVGKKAGSGLDDYAGSDWLELAGGGGGGGRTSALDDLLSSNSSSRRPGTSTATPPKAADTNKPKSAPGGLAFDTETDVHRASQAKGPAAGSAYSIMMSERGGESAQHHKLSILEEERDESILGSGIGGAPTPPSNLGLAATGGHSATGVTPAASTAHRTRPTAGSSILLDSESDIFSSSGDFAPLRVRRPASAEADQAVAGTAAVAPATSQPRQLTPPAAVVPGLTAVLGDNLGADANAVSELARLVQLHNREAQLASELTVVRRHMDVNKLYVQRILGSVFGIDTPLPATAPAGDHSSSASAAAPAAGGAQPETQQVQKLQAAPSKQPTGAENKCQELEGEIAQLRLQIQLLQSIRDTLQEQHNQELEVIRKSYQRQMDELEEAARHKTERLKAQLGDVSEELEATRKRHLDELTEKGLSHKSEIDRLVRDRDDHVRQLQNQHRQDMTELRRAHEEQCSLLRAERRADAAAAGAAPELRVLADHLAELEENVNQRHESHLSLKMAAFGDREAQLRSQELSLAKEREQIRQALAQLESAKNELQQQRWVTEQKEARLSAMQLTVEEERRRMAESSERDRAHLDKMRTDMVEEHSRLLADIFRERQRLGADSERIEGQHRRLLEAKSDLQRQELLNNEIVAKARQAEQQMQTEAVKMAADREKMAAELRAFDEERASFKSVKQDLAEQRRVAEAKLKEAEAVAMKGHEEFRAAQVIRDGVVEAKKEIEEKQTAFDNAQSLLVEERNNISRERTELDQLRSSFVCNQCSRGASMQEVRRFAVEASPRFSDLRQQLQSLEAKLTSDLQQTRAERDTSGRPPAAGRQAHKSSSRKKTDFDYEAEKAWLEELQRYRLQAYVN